MDLEKIIRENLEPIIHMSLATSRDNKPWVSEVHFAYDDDLTLYYRSLKSRRHSEDIARNPHVAGDIVKQHSLNDSPVGIYFEGLATLVEAGEEQNQAFKVLRDRLHISEDTIEEASREDGHQFYKISVTNWYVFGRLNELPGQKYTLAWKGKD